MSDIRIVDVGTGDMGIVLEEKFSGFAVFSKEHNTWLLTQSYDPDPNTPLVMYQHGQRNEVPGHGIGYIWWSSEYDVFFGETADGSAFYSITPDGDITKLSISPEWVEQGQTPHTFIPSPDKKWWVWSAAGGQYPGGDDGIWVGAPWSQPIEIPEGSYAESVWSPDSQHLILSSVLTIVEPPDFKVVRNLKLLNFTLNR